MLATLRCVSATVSTARVASGFARRSAINLNHQNRTRTFSSPSSSVMDAFQKESIVPEVVDAVPKSLLSVTYGSYVVKPNDTMTPTQVKDPPALKWDFEDGAFYTVWRHQYKQFNTYLHAPSRADPQLREFHHWMVVNVPDGDVKKGETKSEYIGSGPPKDTGLHRYVFLVYKQPNGGEGFADLPFLNNRSHEGRPKRTARAILKDMNMEGAELVAGNFYQAEWDDYVPTLHKQIGF